MSNDTRVADLTRSELRSTIQSAVFVAVFGVIAVFACIGVVLRTLL